MLTFDHKLTLRYRNNKKRSKMETIVLLVIAVSLAYGVGCLGSKRKIGFGMAFVISLFNVFVGLIAVLCSKRLDDINPNDKEERV